MAIARTSAPPRLLHIAARPQHITLHHAAPRCTTRRQPPFPPSPPQLPASLDFQFKDPERGFDRDRVKGVRGGSKGAGRGRDRTRVESSEERGLGSSKRRGLTHRRVKHGPVGGSLSCLWVPRIRLPRFSPAGSGPGPIACSHLSTSRNPYGLKTQWRPRPRPQVVARLVRVRDPATATALEVVAGGRLYQVTGWARPAACACAIVCAHVFAVDGRRPLVPGANAATGAAPSPLHPRKPDSPRPPRPFGTPNPPRPQRSWSTPTPPAARC